MAKFTIGDNNNKINKKQPKYRKEIRKEKRLAKKERKNQHYKKRFINLKNEIKNDIAKVEKKNNKLGNKKPSKKKPELRSEENIVQEEAAFEKQAVDHKNSLKEQRKLQEEMQLQRKKQLFVENKYEDKSIKKLEKQLRLNKRKSKTLPQSFMDDGLDYLLDICDSEKIKGAIETEKNLQDSESEFEEDIAVVTGKQKISEETDVPRGSLEDDEFTDDDEQSDCQGKQGNENNLNDDDGDNFDNDISVDEKMDDYDSLDEEMFEENEMDECNSNSELTDTKNEDVYEDIYGRKRDKDGNVIQETGKYIPPHLKARLIDNSGREVLISRLKKQIKGLLNRVSDSNMHFIVTQLDKLFMQSSRNDMNETLTKLTFESLIQPVLSSDRLIIEYTMLIAALHANVGTEVGAHFLQAIVEKFNSTFKCGDISNKEIDNILLVIAYLYSFKVFNNVLIFDILNRIVEVSNFGEKEVELLLIVLCSIGFTLRKDNPVGLKSIIIKVQSVINSLPELLKQSRVRFMLDILNAIKNNNTSKIPNYDPSQLDHYKKVLKNLIQKGKYVSELNINLEDLLKAPERGRWWVVGSAWTGSLGSTNKSTDNVTNHISQTYIDLAKKHHMNTDTRQNIFCIIMSAEDYMDAFEKLLRLGLKGTQEQTIIHVIVHCVIQEKTFNPYYAYLASQFCTAERRHLITIQYHLWDKIRELEDLKKFQITNLALFLSHLLLEKSLPLSALKVIEFASLNKSQVRLLRQILLTILLHENDETVAQVFQRISHGPKLKMFRESIRLFFHHFIIRKVSQDSEQNSRLKKRVKLAESCMNFVVD